MNAAGSLTPVNALAAPSGFDLAVALGAWVLSPNSLS